MLRSRGLLDNSHAAGFTTHAREVLTWINPHSSYEFSPLHADKDCRYVITRCRGKGLEFLAVNVYGPNYNCPDFFTHLANLVGKHEGDCLLWGGDLNLIRNPALDRSDGLLGRTTVAAAALEAAIVRLDQCDIWRQRHPEQGGFTHYSSYYNIHTRIDYWLATTALSQRVKHCSVLPRTLSDHSPLLLEVDPSEENVLPIHMEVSPLFALRYSL